MSEVKQELMEKIEEARQELDNSIDQGLAYDLIYEHSVALDRWIEKYMLQAFKGFWDRVSCTLKKSTYEYSGMCSFFPFFCFS